MTPFPEEEGEEVLALRLGDGTIIDPEQVAVFHEIPEIDPSWSIAQMQDGTVHNRWRPFTLRWVKTEVFIKKLRNGGPGEGAEEP